VLRKNLPYYRKLSKASTHLQLLRDACNTAMCAKQPGIDEYAKDFVIQVLEIMTSEEMTRFPASFYAVAKSENNVKTTEGILASLKYISIIPKVDKVIHVSTRCFEYDKSGQPIKVDGIEEGKEGPNNLQFHAAVKLLLPMLNKDSETKLKLQINNPDKYLTEKTQAFYKQNASHVDAITKAYAYSSSFNKNKKKKGKTRLVHVSNEINKVSREIVRALPYQDARGKTYASYMDIRHSYRKILENLLKRKESPRKKLSPEELEDLRKERKKQKRTLSKSPGRKTKSRKSTPASEEEAEMDICENS